MELTLGADLRCTLSNPVSCAAGRVERSSDVFVCDSPSNDERCDPRAHQVNIRVYSVGGAYPCGELPSSLPTLVWTLESGRLCRELAKTSDTLLWSAGFTDRVSGAAISPWPDLARRTLADGAAVVRLGAPTGLLGGPRARPFSAELAAAQSLPLSALHPSIRAVWSFHPPLEGGVELVADVQRTFESVSGHGTVMNRHELAGVVLSGGRFALSDTRRVACEDQPSELLIEELAYDGGNFFRGVVGAPFYDAYSSESAAIDPAMAGLGFVEPLLAWVDSPHAILRFPGTTYAEETVAGSNGARLRVLETYPGVPLELDKGQTLYEIELVDGVAHVTRIAISNSQGDLLVERLYSDYRTLSQDLWRAFQFTERRFNAGSTTPYVSTTVSIRRARALDPAAASAAWRRPKSEHDWWFVRT